MKFNFKIQQYQTEAVEAIVRVFNGQPNYDRTTYIRDLGKLQPNQQMQLAMLNDDDDIMSDTGYKNEAIELTDAQLLENIRTIQSENNIKTSDKLIGDIGRCSLDIEMETGTGKTYVYLRSIFELNKVYGFKKFFIVVPSVAIREGVLHSITTMKEHFQTLYDNVPFDHTPSGAIRTEPAVTMEISCGLSMV